VFERKRDRDTLQFRADIDCERKSGSGRQPKRSDATQAGPQQP
jgi:hypothetical protein